MLCLLLQTERPCRRHHPSTTGSTRSIQTRQSHKLSAPTKWSILESRISFGRSSSDSVSHARFVFFLGGPQSFLAADCQQENRKSSEHPFSNIHWDTNSGPNRTLK